ncbi:MAG: DUF429 domain-containing protein [Methanocellales archaeon]|nr:DUF429 domain-containing protein [Methanocellales archaeon]
MKYVGIDLSTRKSGYAVLDECRKLTSLALFDFGNLLDAIVDLNRKSLPVAIDAPLTFPITGIWRECDLMLRKLGITCYAPGAPFFRGITELGSRLRCALEKKGIRVMEVYPYATRLRCNIGAKVKKNALQGRRQIQSDLGKFVVDLPEEILNSHLLDAILAAYTAYLAAHDMTETLSGRDGTIIIPKKDLSM